jgi:hypothetical protein
MFTVAIGIRIRKLWRLKRWVALSLVVALLAAVWSVDQISLAPPGLTPRSLEMATATTHVLVDTPDSIMVDLRQETYSFQDLTNRAVVLGNVLTSPAIEAAIAAEAGIPAGVLRIQAPLTPQQSSLPVNAQNQRKITDILKLNDQYRIALSVDPTVPMLDIYAQTPTARSAAALANGAFDQLRSYLASLAKTEDTPVKDQVRLVQLGRATGIVINPGVRYQAAVLAFILTFLASCATVVFFARVREGWRVAALSERVAGA